MSNKKQATARTADFRVMPGVDSSAVLDALAGHIAVLDEQGRIVAVNSAWTRFARERGENLLGYDVGDNYLDTVRTLAGQGNEHAIRSLMDLNAVLSGQSVECDLEVAFAGTSGERWYLMHAAPLADSEGCVISYLDITASKQQAHTLQQAYDEVKRTQEQLVQSEKMASIGQLTSGVAHEINNPVGYLNSNLGTLEQYFGDVLRMVKIYEETLAAVSDPVLNETIQKARQATDFSFVIEDIPKLLAESQEGTKRVRKIVQDLKDFAHAGNSDEWEWADLRNNLARTLNIVRNELKYKAEVLQSYEDIPEVRCLPGQLNQVFMNLLVNAAHAIDKDGQVSIRTWQENDQVGVEIADTGCGMPPDVIARIFEPFFTTKPVGKGTGLGLSISHGIVKRHGGRIEVESEVGRGTRFRIMLPISGPEEKTS